MVIERAERSRAGEIRQSVMKLNLAQNNMATLCASTPSSNQERKESHWLNAGKKGICRSEHQHETQDTRLILGASFFMIIMKAIL